MPLGKVISNCWHVFLRVFYRAMQHFNSLTGISCSWSYYALPVIGLLVFRRWLWKRIQTDISDSLPLPPQPQSRFIFSFKGLPQTKPWETYNRWSKTYGDIMLLRTPTNNIIILNSTEAVTELLERRSTTYASRPHLVMFKEILDFPIAAFVKLGPTWKKNRNIVNQKFNKVVSQKYQVHQARAVQQLLSLLLSSPDKFEDHIRHYIAGVMISLIYGYTISRENDQVVALVDERMKCFSQVVQPGYFLVDNFPILKYFPGWFPGMKFKKYARVFREIIRKGSDIPFDNFKTHMDTEVVPVPSSFVSGCFTEIGPQDEEDVKTIKSMAAAIVGAGVGSTTDYLLYFVLIMIMFPTVQTKGQEEIDRIIGNSRLPRFEDRPDLPYVNAILQEVLRWCPALPFALPRLSSQDDQYRGYRIPKGSIVIPNTWNVLHDPAVYSNPDEFKPERFLPDENGTVAKDPFSHGAFGYGRRICPGRHLADASLFIAVASLLSTFNIRPAIDKKGHEVDVSHALDPHPGFISSPQHFQCRFEPRSIQARRVIIEAALPLSP